jgi:putative transposase
VGKNAAKNTVTSRQSAVLEPLARSRTAPQRLVERCRIVLMSAEGKGTEDQGEELGVDRQRVRRWRDRWASASGALSSAEHEGATDKDLQNLILAVLADDARSGAPAKFTPEQVAAIIALACEPPAQSGLPVSHWTPTELTREAIKRKIRVPPDPLRVHASPLLLAQPGRDLVFDPRATAAEAVQLHVGRRSQGSGAPIHRVLEQRPGQAVSLDIHRQAASGVSADRMPSSASDVLCRRLEVVANGNRRNARPITATHART